MSEALLRITTAASWVEAQAAGEVSPPSFATERFVHCSRTHQVLTAAATHFAGQHDLVLLRLDPSRLGAPVVEEAAATGELYPHVYRLLPTVAVTEVLPLAVDDEGAFRLPPELV